MIGLISRVFAQLASYASIVGLYITAYPPSAARPDWHWYILSVITLSVIVLVCRDIWEAIHRSHKTFWSRRGINRYMCRLIAREGRTVIFSRDLSWGNQEDARKALTKKARAGELTIYLHHDMPLANELRAFGATIIIYGKPGLEPKSRFTIIGYGKEGSRVAVGTKRKGRQVVYEFDTGEHPVHALAEDLIRHLHQEVIQ